MSNRRIFILFPLFLCCGKNDRRSAPLFPPTVGPWKLRQARDLDSTSIPEQIRRFAPQRAQSAEYDGAGVLHADIYKLRSSAAGLELEQTWKPAANTVAFHRDNYFVVVRWENADRSAVNAFVREIVK